MRVLLINDYGTSSGGAERQMIALRAGLRDRGHDARLFTSDAMLIPGWRLEADATCRGTVGRAQPYLQSWNPFAAAALKRELRDFPPDVVHVRMFLWQLSPAILPLLAKVPTLYQAAVYKAVCPNGLKILPDGSNCAHRAGRVCLSEGCVAPPTWLAAMWQLRQVRRHWRNIDRSVALSREMADILTAGGLGAVDVVHNGIAERPQRAPLSDPPLIAYAGRLSREKGVDVLIDAFAEVRAAIPDAQLLIAGSGPLEAVLRARAAMLGLSGSVEFAGYLHADAMERRFDAAWVQAVPSVWREPFGNVTTEAMMRGSAVVASRVGGQPEIVVDGTTGFLVPPGDPLALAGALLRICRDRALAERLGDAGRTRALRHFSRGAVLDNFEKIYIGLAQQRNSARHGAD